MSSFADRVKDRIDGVFIRADKTKKAVAFGLLSQIVQGTPFDTGTARGNWQVSAARPLSGTVENTSPQVAINLGTNVIRQTKLEDDIIIQNNLPYIYRLEYDGWSKVQAPNGWVRAAIARFSQLFAIAWRQSK